MDKGGFPAPHWLTTLLDRCGAHRVKPDQWVKLGQYTEGNMSEKIRITLSWGIISGLDLEQQVIEYKGWDQDALRDRGAPEEVTLEGVRAKSFLYDLAHKVKTRGQMNNLET